MQRFIQDLGVLTGGEQNDMFFCRNPSMATPRPDFNSGGEVESLSDSETAHISGVGEVRDSNARNSQTAEAQTRESLELPERDRKLSSSKKENIDKLYKSLKKKVSFDKGQSYSLFEEAKGEANSERASAPRQKRSLPRQEIAIDLESPVSNKRLQDNYPIIAHAGLSDVNGQSGQEKKRRMVKDKMLKCENAGPDSSQSTELSSFSGISQESTDHSNEAEFNTQTKGRETLVVPNLVVKTSITENSSVYGTSNEVLPSKASDETGSLASPHVVNDNISEKPIPDTLDGKNAIPDRSFMNCDNDESSKSLSMSFFPQASQNSSEKSPSRNCSGITLPPADENENKHLGSPEFPAKNDDSKSWSRSVLDSSKETSL
jgi:hypothetical protein